MADLPKLDPWAPQKVEYCIPEWLKIEQIKSALKKVAGRLLPAKELKEEPAAIACFGPSLNDTWEKLRDFKYVFTCSGSHKFLIERGIIPYAHCEVDPRVHKIELLGEPHKDVIYFPSSTCHPKYFDYLINAGVDIRMWHVFDNEEEALRILPPGEWSITGGCSIGLRCITIARFLGFRELHVFGMDGSIGPSGNHAAAHPNQQKNLSVVTVEGVEYRTTPSLLEAARQTWHELNQLPDVKCIFYGDGLVQAMSKSYVPNYKNKPAVIAFHKSPLISPEYRALNAKLHAENMAFGIGGAKHAEVVLQLYKTLKTPDGRPASILDYGAGRRTLAKELGFPIYEYDPAVPEISECPRPADLVVCTDVLEHIEPEYIDNVLSDIQRCTKQVGYFIIHTGPSMKKLSDGRNAHLIQQGVEWWSERLNRYFTVGKIFEKGPHLHVIVGPKSLKSKKKAS